MDDGKRESGLTAKSGSTGRHVGMKGVKEREEEGGEEEANCL